MKRMLTICLLLAGFMSALYASVVTYTPDNTTIFKNPERGFTEEQSYKVSTSHPNVIKGNVSDSWGKKYNMTLMVVLYNFGKFKAQDLPDEILAGFDEDMQELRNYGLKCVLRFAYTETESDKEDAKPDWVKRHLEQLKPHLAANADVIYVLEAGFVGVWGEWYYTANYGNETQHLNAKRRQVIDYLFANAPADRFILFRYPMIKTEYLGTSEPLTADEAFTGSVRARMGCHNDAFLNTWGDMGTYASDNLSDDPKVRAYIAEETLYVPNGGETNIDDDESLAESRYTRAPAEMSTYHWSFCGSSYAIPVTKRWRQSGLFDTLNIHMGYRYNLINAIFTDQAAPGGKANISIRLRNDGYAPLYNARTAYIVLKNGSGQTWSLPLQSDPRRWLPNGVVSTINEQVSIPADLPEGTYRLYLHLPDKYTTIASDPRFAVRCANTGMWDEQSGMNDLKASITISATAPLDPGTLPDIDNALEDVQNDSQARPKKILEDGYVYILMPDGRRHTILGN